ncbi:hypothetical protein TVAG_346260 [Trichomonas vaginalis G3]|uniref:Mediator of RNA polymerase II transcription subunit 21 n=1 Tax=Trichomonas vaginalis (strain ATCC PRA-98 / G3) TaxID=412133 RepID=A2FK16_TRIV3|nr:subunit 21 of Mediator complex family [Trichomonas vaginalis G3]EAX94763.1 hypothetical protein TVAG_346260 [Trichomonas vaginalis G3]KAI5491991.1 subunit 21 of Mediator complex family [Trichomonas vaginalis G3]|eukprot:XP_001307693.1 hypothetical protein [Trichomonas vaginalis G3]
MSAPKLRDHVGLLQEGFEGLLTTIFRTIENIQRDACLAPGTNENQLKFENLPQIAEEIVKRVKYIDALIDEADKETCIGKDEKEILQSLNDKNLEYEQDVESLSQNCEQAEKWLGRIRQMLDVIASNTWMHQTETQDQ